MIYEEGKELVESAEDQCLGLGNGVTKGDEEGEWTQIGQRGCTTIDYLVRYEEGRYRIQAMVVKNRIKSDYSPIEMRIEWKGGVEKVSGEEREEAKNSVTR